MSLIFDSAWLSISDEKDRYWAFYKANATEYDKILWDASWQHVNVLEPEDMHSDLLLRMYRSDFLTTFDATKSAFGTFVTGRVFGYASHIVTQIRNKTKGWEQALCSGLNCIKEDEAVDAAPEVCSTDEDYVEGSDLPVEPSYDFSLFDDTILQEINRALPPIEACIFTHYRNGYSHSEIAVMIKESENLVKEYINRIKIKIREIFDGIKILYKNGEELTSDDEKVLIILRSKGLIHEENGTLVIKNVVKETTNDNGHAIARKRGLSEHEKEIIKAMFISVNGMIKENTSLRMKAAVGKDISIFQVTGAIVGLHRKAARGEIALRNPKSYKAFMANHRKQWATYKSSKYQTPKYQAALAV